MTKLFGSSLYVQRGWLIIGHENNWQTALSEPIPIWGFKEKDFSSYKDMQPGGFLVFYATTPIKGIIGIGSLKDKYIDHHTLIWDDEKESKKVIWPLRFRFEVWHLLPVDLWKSGSVSISDLNMNLQTSVIYLGHRELTAILTKIKEKWGILSLEKESFEYVGPTLVAPTEREKGVIDYQAFVKPEDLHKKLQMTVAEIGKLQSYYTEVEYPLQLTGETRRLDVVWKREAMGVPTFAFEVEVSGQIERAVAKLKQAYSLWNSRPLLVISEKEHIKVKNLVEKETASFKEAFCFYDFSVIEELYAKKKDLRDFEKQLRIY